MGLGFNICWFWLILDDIIMIGIIVLEVWWIMEEKGVKVLGIVAIVVLFFF